MTLCRAVALSMGAALIGALTIPVIDHPYGLVGAMVFGVGGACLLHVFPSRKAGRRALLAAAFAGLLTTVGLHYASINTLIVKNASGRSVRSLSWHPTLGGQSYSFANIPDGAVVRFQFHDLFHDGRGNLAGGQLADATPLLSHASEIRGARYDGTTEIRINESGSISVTWP